MFKNPNLKFRSKDVSRAFCAEVRAIYGLGTLAPLKRDALCPRQRTSMPACSRVQKGSIQLLCSLQLERRCQRATPWPDDHDGEFCLRTAATDMSLHCWFKAARTFGALGTH